MVLTCVLYQSQDGTTTPFWGGHTTWTGGCVVKHRQCLGRNVAEPTAIWRKCQEEWVCSATSTSQARRHQKLSEVQPTPVWCFWSTTWCWWLVAWDVKVADDCWCSWARMGKVCYSPSEGRCSSLVGKLPEGKLQWFSAYLGTVH